MRCPRVNYCDGVLCNYFAVCSNGFVPYWTDSERAGLKALGHFFLNEKYRMDCNKNIEVKSVRAVVCSTIRDAIMEFVAAARKAKES
jgi:hypothetical protein